MSNVWMIFMRFDKVLDDPDFEFFGENLLEDNPIRIISNEKVFLYAVSDSEEYTYEFLNMRDKNKFILAKKKMSKDKKTSYLNSHNNEKLIKVEQSFHDQVAPVIMTGFENEMYSSMYDVIDDEIVSDPDQIFAMELIYKLLKKKYVRYCDGIGITNILNSIKSIDEGEPIYLEPDFFRFMMRYFKFTF